MINGVGQLPFRLLQFRLLVGFTHVIELVLVLNDYLFVNGEMKASLVSSSFVYDLHTCNERAILQQT